jgi:hypothetical protein
LDLQLAALVQVLLRSVQLHRLAQLQQHQLLARLQTLVPLVHHLALRLALALLASEQLPVWEEMHLVVALARHPRPTLVQPHRLAPVVDFLRKFETYDACDG